MQFFHNTCKSGKIIYALAYAEVELCEWGYSWCVAIYFLTHRLGGVHGSGCGCGLDPGGCGFVESDVQSAGIWLPLVATPKFPDLAGRDITPSTSRVHSDIHTSDILDRGLLRRRFG